MVHDLQPGDPQLIGPYRLRGVLSTGGMGRVFLGSSADGRPVAVKVIRGDLATDPDFRDLFRREVEVARTVSGPFTAPVIERCLVKDPTPAKDTAPATDTAPPTSANMTVSSSARPSATASPTRPPYPSPSSSASATPSPTSGGYGY